MATGHTGALVDNLKGDVLNQLMADVTSSNCSAPELALDLCSFVGIPDDKPSQWSGYVMQEGLGNQDATSLTASISFHSWAPDIYRGNESPREPAWMPFKPR